MSHFELPAARRWLRLAAATLCMATLSGCVAHAGARHDGYARHEYTEYGHQDHRPRGGNYRPRDGVRWRARPGYWHDGRHGARYRHHADAGERRGERHRHRSDADRRRGARNDLAGESRRRGERNDLVGERSRRRGRTDDTGDRRHRGDRQRNRGAGNDLAGESRRKRFSAAPMLSRNTERRRRRPPSQRAEEYYR